MSLEDLIKNARRLQDANMHTEAIHLLESIIITAEKEKSPGLASLLNDLGLSQVLTGDYRGAFDSNNRALIVARNPLAEDQEQAGRALIDLSYIQRVYLNDRTESIKSLEGALTLRLSDVLRGKALDFLARAYVGTEDNVKAISSCEEAVGIYSVLLANEGSNHGYRRRLADAQHILGRAYELNNQDTLAYTSQEVALENYESTNNLQGIANASIAMGRIRLKQGALDLAIIDFKKALDVQDDNRKECQPYVTNASMELAYSYLLKGRPDLARSHLERFREGYITDFHQREIRLVTPDHYAAYSAKFAEIRSLCDQHGLILDGIGKLSKLFGI